MTWQETIGGVPVRGDRVILPSAGVEGRGSCGGGVLALQTRVRRSAAAGRLVLESGLVRGWNFAFPGNGSREGSSDLFGFLIARALRLNQSVWR